MRLLKYIVLCIVVCSLFPVRVLAAPSLVGPTDPAELEAFFDGLMAAHLADLATNDPSAAFPGTGAYVSLLLIALAGLLFSRVMLRFNRAMAIVGLLASGCDLAY